MIVYPPVAFIPARERACFIKALYVDVKLKWLNTDFKPANGADHIKFTVPKGFCTNGANIPSVVWPLIGTPFSPKYVGPAGVHDYLYCTCMYPRQVADAVFKFLLEMNDVSSLKASMMYTAVRIGGSRYYKDSAVDVVPEKFLSLLV